MSRDDRCHLNPWADDRNHVNDGGHYSKWVVRAYPGPSPIWLCPMRPDAMRPDGFIVPGRVGRRAGRAAQARPYGMFFGPTRRRKWPDGPRPSPTLWRHVAMWHRRQRCAPAAVSRRRKLKGRRTPPWLELWPLRSRWRTSTRPELRFPRAARRRRRLREGTVHAGAVGAPAPAAEAAHSSGARLLQPPAWQRWQIRLLQLRRSLRRGQLRACIPPWLSAGEGGSRWWGRARRRRRD
jgi:hypothetical protein